MKIEFTISENTFVVSCGRPSGSSYRKWNGLRKCFRVTLQINDGKPIWFSYYDSRANYPYPINEKGLKRAFECYVNDALAARYCNGVEDFMREFGYENRREAGGAYVACEKALGFFNEHGVDVVELYEYLNEEE
jgi:hypothetical protein